MTWNEAEGPILAALGVRPTPAAALAATSQPVLDWIKAEGISRLAVHFDLDVLDPAHFSPPLFNRPDAPKDGFDGIEQGKMRLEQVVLLLKDAGSAADMVSLAVTEHLPWDMLRLKSALADLPVMRS